MLVRKIENAVREKISDKIAMEKIQILLTQLNERILFAGQIYKHQMKKTTDIQDTSCAELFMEKNGQITKLQFEIDELKKVNDAYARASHELSMVKNELIQLKETLDQRNDEINHLNYKAVCAQSQIEQLQKEKNANTQHLNVTEKEIENHFSKVKRILTSNRDLLKLINVKQFKSRNSIEWEKNRKSNKTTWLLNIFFCLN